MPNTLQRLHTPDPLYIITLLSWLLPQFRCRSCSFRPKRVSVLHCQCWSSLFSSHSKRRTLTQSFISAAPMHNLKDRLMMRDSETQRNCCCLARGLQGTSVNEVALSTVMHLLCSWLKIRKLPLSGGKQRETISLLHPN